MPTFWSRSTRIHLSIDKAGLTSAMPPTRQHGSQSGASATTRPTSASTPLATSALSETILQSQDDEAGLQFLGEHKDMPFFMVRAGKELFVNETGRDLNQQRRSDASQLTTISQSHATATPSIAKLVGDSEDRERPQFLKPTLPLSTPGTDPRHSYGILTVASPIALDFGSSTSSSLSSFAALSSTSGLELSPVQTRSPAEQSFCRPISTPTSQQALTHCSLAINVSLSKSSFVRSSDAIAKPQDICISVFFNGEFTDSRIVSTRVLSGTPGPFDSKHVFTGRRVDRTSERRWVLVPSGQNPDGSLRLSRRTKLAGTTARERWASIGKALEEEAEQWGMDEHGQRSTIGEYLAGLARLQMPPDVETIQTATGQQYGVVDVIIALGRAKKNPATAPYLRAPTRVVDPRFVSDRGGGRRSVQRQEAVTAGRVPMSPVRKNLTVKSSSATSSQAPRNGSSRVRVRETPKTPRTPARKLAALKPRTKVGQEDRFPATLGQTLSLSRPAGGKFDLELIPASASPGVWSPKSAVAALSDTSGREGNSTAEADGAREGQTASLASPSLGHPSSPRAQALGSSQDPSCAPLKTEQRPNETKATTKRMRAPNLTGLGLQGSSWTPSVLCSDSFITYAEDEGWKRGMQYGNANPMYRPCRSERGATMETAGVLMGVRFVVG